MRFKKHISNVFLVGLLGIVLYWLVVPNAGNMEYIGRDKCVVMDVPVGYGCEDVVSASDGTILVGCSNILDALQPFKPKYFGYETVSTRIKKLRNKGLNKGKIFAVEFDGDGLKANLIELKMKGYGDNDFLVHGMSLYYDQKSDMHLLYVVNHRSDGEYISVFQYIKADYSLTYYGSFTSDKFDYMNNVQILSHINGDFYVSNSLKHEPGTWTAFFETITRQKTNSVLFCKPEANILNHDYLTPMDTNVECNYVDKDMVDANGLSINKNNNELYVVSETQIIIYHTSNHSIKTKIDIKYPGDNINRDVSEENNIFHVSIFQNPTSLMLYLLGLTTKKPMTTILKIIQSNDDTYNTDIILSIPGDDIGPCTGAAMISGKLVGVSIFDNKILACQGL